MFKRHKLYGLIILGFSSIAILIHSNLLLSGLGQPLADEMSTLPRDANGTLTSRKEKFEMLTKKLMPKAKLDFPEDTNRSILLTLSTMRLPQFNRNFKNPCWYDHYNNLVTLRCFPYFFLAGFAKCGTTDLFYRLETHPLIIRGTVKEPHYLSRVFFKEPTESCSSKFHCGSVSFSSKFFTEAAQLISMTDDTKFIHSTFTENGDPSDHHVQFLKAFPRESIAIWKKGQQVHKYPGITVDASVSTAWDNKLFIHYAENLGYDFPRNTTADWIRHINPNTKIIMLLRDPVTRVFSQYNYVARERANAQEFHRKVERATAQMDRCLQSGKSGLHCTTLKYPTSIFVGMYYYHIKTWFQKLPRNQFLILKYEDYIANMPKTLARVFHFLGLPAVSQKGLEFMSRSNARNKVSYKVQMLPESKDVLTKFYRPLNEKLAKLLGDDRFLWE